MSIDRSDVFGLVRPSLDVHLLGVSSFAQLLHDCGLHYLIAGKEICSVLNKPDDPEYSDKLILWIKNNKISYLGFSYRLDTNDAFRLFNRFYHSLINQEMFSEQGGPVKKVFFAGLPEACIKIQYKHRNKVTVFFGDESIMETLNKIGITDRYLPHSFKEQVVYDEARYQFGKELIESDVHRGVKPVDRSRYATYGTRHDSLVTRVEHAIRYRITPLMRAHIGPYNPDRTAGVNEFLQWCHELSKAGFLDILSIGSSQLTQSSFGEDWTGLANGGGVPINKINEYHQIWEAARPMLVRTYAGTRNIEYLAKMYEETINIAWHALSFWWFCSIDGRGPYTLQKNLEEQYKTLQYIASTGKPFEPNIPHHFSFRGSDDITYVVSAVIAARVAKKVGIKYLILQIMLNTPKATWGIQDLAKSRALLSMIKSLEDGSFKIYLQTRAGLDYLSHDLEKAKIQLAAVTGLMDDIEPDKESSPDIIHVVGYSEGSFLATPTVVNESIQITSAALKEYRKKRKKGIVEDMRHNKEVMERTVELVENVKIVLRYIEDTIINPYSPQGLYKIFELGFLPVPYLMDETNMYPNATMWKTKVINGSCRVVNNEGYPINIIDRILYSSELGKKDFSR